MKFLPVKQFVILTVLALTTAQPIHAEIATVNYVHKYLTKVWDISIPHTDANSNIISMRYTMSVVDKANEALNGTATTDYANDPKRATSNIATTTAVRDAIENLIVKQVQEAKFVYTTQGPVDFSINARGTFQVDYGDGTIMTYDNTVDGDMNIDFFHEYTDGAPQHKVTLTGLATQYDTDTYPSTIEFPNAYDITEIDGCLGCIFPTLDDNSQPNFAQTFYEASFTKIPAGLFHGIHGRARSSMFESTFYESMVESVPDELFAEITGGAELTFSGTFAYCQNLKTIGKDVFKNVTFGGDSMFEGTFEKTGIESIPDGMFAGIIHGDTSMFSATFSRCENLKTIGRDVFKNLKSGGDSMFIDTFYNTGIERIPDEMFANLTEGEDMMFYNTFYGCEKLTEIGNGMFRNLNNKTDWMFLRTFSNTKNLTTIGDDMFESLEVGTEDLFKELFVYSPRLTNIGKGMFKSLKIGAPRMFKATFAGTNITSVPADMFANLTEGAEEMFLGTFDYCENLTNVPLFPKLKTGAPRMFDATFVGTNITSLPDNMFESLTEGAEEMFVETFASCENLTTISNILPALSAPSTYPTDMFFGTFSSNTSLTNTLHIGPNKKELWELWPDVQDMQGTYYESTQIPGYEDIPDVWRLYW